MAKKKILAVPEGGIFLKRDVEILKNHFEVKTAPTFNRKKPISSIPSIFKILKGTLWADVTFSWFADTHAFLAVLFSKIFRKKSIVVVGGYDVEKLPEIGYGAMRNPLFAKVVKFVLKYADKILPFSDFVAEEALSVSPNSNLDIIPLACDTQKFVPGGQKENLVLTVCHIIKTNIARKGLRTFVESAKHLPEVRFAIVGAHVDESINYLIKISPPNVGFTGFVSEEELINWYQKAKVYCQLSFQEGEGPGGAIGEAMACECIPIISLEAIALREGAGDCGIYVPYGDVGATVEAIKQALNSSPELGRRARERMRNMFSMEKRGNELLRVINEVLK